MTVEQTRILFQRIRLPIIFLWTGSISHRFVSRSTIRDGIQPPSFFSNECSFDFRRDTRKRKNLYNRFNRLEYVSLSPPSSSFSYKKRGNIFPREVFILTGKEFKSVFFLEKEEVRTKKEGRKGGRKRTFAFLAETISSSFVSFSLSLSILLF